MDRVLARCGCLYGLKYGPEELEQLQRSHKIDKIIQKDKQVIRRQVKLLLLGAGESGKSTFLKQMRIIHNFTFDPEQLLEFRAVVFQNVLRGMKVLVDAREKLDIPWQDPANDVHARRLLCYDASLEPLDADTFGRYAPSVRCLWQDAGIRNAFERRIEFQLGDGVRYFFEHLDRIATKVNHCFPLSEYASCCAFVIYQTLLNGIPFRFVDVGGQRSQRQKWFRCFDSVTSILFLVSSSEYDQALLEDRCTNRLVESRSIFETIVNNRCFAEVSIILFFNKTDLLREKVRSRSTCIADYIEGFRGDPHDLAQVQRFLVDWFYQARKQEKPLFHHFTTAVDTENIKVVFNAVRNTILQKNITQLMLN
ncbi:hypothetical protein HPB48_021657 [Haemaphysalis longicornis]|uniref:G-protein alpha subunit n=1 Tax=Haemaphysalis longicornis TaxID=44386 RepID=A0A9J6FSX5_HAELO|nr:hypothetical protein HPB48_021657 [Haemaphysalis longicornis]